jgi:hypothetical protein
MVVGNHTKVPEILEVVGESNCLWQQTKRESKKGREGAVVAEGSSRQYKPVLTLGGTIPVGEALLLQNSVPLELYTGRPCFQ